VENTGKQGVQNTHTSLIWTNRNSICPRLPASLQSVCITHCLLSQHLQQDRLTSLTDRAFVIKCQRALIF